MEKHPHKTLFIIAFSIFVIVALAYGYMYRSVEISMGNVVDLRTKIEARDYVMTEGRSLAVLASDTETSRAKVYSHTVKADKVVDIIVAIEALGQKSGSKVSIATIDSSAASQASSTTKDVTIEVTTNGSWQSVMKVLRMAETLPYISYVDGVRLDVTDKHVWTLNFNVRTFTI